MTSSYNGSIPGLKREHFTCDISDDKDRLCIPTLTKSKVYSDGQSFYFSWTASYGRREKYYLQATGNIAKGDQWKNNGPKWWGFECRCSCPQFADQEQKTIASNYMEHNVCHHLQIALELCVDLTANNGPPSPTSVVVPTSVERENVASLPAPPSIEEADICLAQPESPTRNEKAVEQIIIPRLTRFHFIDDSTRCKCRRTPIAIAAEIDQERGEFQVHWQYAGEIGDDDEDECYNLRASGNIKQLEKTDGPQWWGFSVSCDCPDFLRQRLRCDTESGWTQNFVCPHLGRALESARDPERMKNSNEDHHSMGENSMDALLAVDSGAEPLPNYNDDIHSTAENSIDALLAVDDSDEEGSTSFLEGARHIADTKRLEKTYDDDIQSTDENSMDALLAVDGSDDEGSTSILEPESHITDKDIGISVLKEEERSDGSSTIILDGEDSLGSLLSSLDNVSMDGSSMSAILSVE